MEYMLLILGDENSGGPAPGTPEFDEMMATWFAYNQKLIGRRALDLRRQPPADHNSDHFAKRLGLTAQHH